MNYALLQTLTAGLAGAAAALEGPATALAAGGGGGGGGGAASQSHGFIFATGLGKQDFLH